MKKHTEKRKKALKKILLQRMLIESAAVSCTGKHYGGACNSGQMNT